MQYLSFSVWLISLSTSPLKPNQAVAGGRFLKVGCFAQCTRSRGLSRNQKGQTLKPWHRFPPADSGRSGSVLWLEQCWVTERLTHVQPWASPGLPRMRAIVQPSEKRTYKLGLAANLIDLGLLWNRKTFCLLTFGRLEPSNVSVYTQEAIGHHGWSNKSPLNWCFFVSFSVCASCEIMQLYACARQTVDAI